MLLRLVYKELLEHLLSLRFAIACVLCFIVILTSLFVRCEEFGQKIDDYHENIAVNKASLRKARHPWHFVWEGTTAYRPPSPLGIFVRGSDSGEESAAHVRSFFEPRFLSSDTQNPTTRLFPAMDMVSFVGIIMSLLAIVFGYDAISGEKERGTLRLVLSYSVPRDTVLLGKWLGGYIALTVPFLLAIVSGAVIVLAQPNVSLTGGEWLRLAFVSVISLIYIAGIYSAAVWVSSITWRSSTSVMILVTIWMLLVLAVPNLSPYLARAWVPGASEQRKWAMLGTRKSGETYEREFTEKLKRYDAEHFEAGTPWHRQLNWGTPEGRRRGLKRQRYERECQRNFCLTRMRSVERIDRDFRNKLAAQEAVGRWLSRISPFSCFASSAMELTGTGSLGQERFMEQVSDYQEVMTKYGFDEWLARYDHELETGKHAPTWRNPDNRKNPVPAFQYEAPATGEYLAAAAVDIGLLLAAVVVFFMLNYFAFLRYDVR